MNPQNTPPTSLCDAARDLLPAYGMGIADAEERALVERGLVECPELEDELLLYGDLAESLLFSAPVVAPPAPLRAKLLEAVAFAQTVQPARAVPETLPDRRPPLPAWQRWLDTFFRPSWQLRPALALAVLALFVVTNVFWLVRLQQLESDTAQTALNSQGNLLNFLGTGQATRVEFNTAADAPQAALTWAQGAASKTWIGLFSVRNLPPLENGTYQGWLIRGEEAVSIGLFTVNADGTGWLIFEVDEPIDGYDLLGVTAEPTGGSPAPTTNPLLAGQL